MSRCSTCWGIVAYLGSLDGWDGGAWDSGIVLGIVDGGSGRGAQVHWTFTFNDFRENWVIAFAGVHRHHGFGGNCRRGGEVQSLHQESVNRLLGPLWGRAEPPVQCSVVRLCKKAAGFLQISFSLLPRRPKLRSPLSSNSLYCVLMKMMNLVFRWEVRPFWRRGKIKLSQR